MFAEWTQPDYRKLLEADLKHTKITKVIKSPETCDKIFQVYLDNIEVMLDHFYY
jgi:hypothetical protein